MIKQWISNLTPKQIVIYLLMIAVSIYVVWYVVEALDGLKPNYRPGMDQGDGQAESPKESYGAFDPTKKKSTSGLSTTVGFACEYNSVAGLVSCSAKRTSDKSSLTWKEDLSAQTSEEENFEFSVSDADKTQINVTLEECVGTACNKVTETVTIAN